MHNDNANKDVQTACLIMHGTFNSSCHGTGIVFALECLGYMNVKPNEINNHIAIHELTI